MKKVAFYTLGCKLNYSETSTISRMFEQKGYEKVEFNQKPDIFIVNTCSVTENADKKCKKIVKEAKKINPDGYVTIIGCYAQLKPTEISEIEGVDAVLGAAEKFQLIDLLDGFVKQPSGEKAVIYNKNIEEAVEYHTSFSLNDRTRTFLKVQDGCDYPCAYCTIPLARGASRSDTIENVVKAAREIAENGVKEIVLTGVNIGDFGLRNGKREETFFNLVNALDQVEGIERIRISSIEPNLLTDEIIDFVAKSERFVPHFHIPLQSGSNKVLGLMKRRYKRELYQERVAKIKSVMPHCCIGVDVIVGHPGETDEAFLESYNFLNELDISYLHVFTYSERENTAALAIKPVVPAGKRSERSKMLHVLSDKKRRFFYEQQLNKTFKVLFEEDVENAHQNGQMSGFTENYVRVSAKYDPLLINELKEVALVSINADMIVEVQEAEVFETH
ncbi:threonylcarbamoyladenosine tRNA methylthiotransferase MtaB [Pseudarcicella hirudinis]|uniref:Threonylcarbamoyladenosine tRNA methylthiotransferase MtaB n=1 Tax=Pseudarcicella hirudinis TaxID=1079859 RepID=A0A1I5N455_9BACT|nr:tRNA (N(6)-L-threonylcarbamoyladenosine(37)-C(2))-methylthiotransferase MtaB [Pseudarcicella hirudinis]SFP16477.1 threonylcarbamoyladenosine tRNA methylthiotransferase MtaB [Pseudarcicella hirudinis]